MPWSSNQFKIGRLHAPPNTQPSYGPAGYMFAALRSAEIAAPAFKPRVGRNVFTEISLVFVGRRLRVCYERGLGTRKSHLVIFSMGRGVLPSLIAAICLQCTLVWCVPQLELATVVRFNHALLASKRRFSTPARLGVPPWRSDPYQNVAHRPVC